MIDEDDDDRFIPLPNQREINEYGMMEEFVSNVRNDSQRAALEIAISGRGAFRRFKDTIIRLGLEKKWYAFRDKEYLRVAREWCEENKIEYEPTDPCPVPRRGNATDDWRRVGAKPRTGAAIGGKVPEKATPARYSTLP